VHILNIGYDIVISPPWQLSDSTFPAGCVGFVATLSISSLRVCVNAYTVCGSEITVVAISFLVLCTDNRDDDRLWRHSSSDVDGKDRRFLLLCLCHLILRSASRKF